MRINFDKMIFSHWRAHFHSRPHWLDLDQPHVGSLCSLRSCSAVPELFPTKDPKIAPEPFRLRSLCFLGSRHSWDSHPWHVGTSLELLCDSSWSSSQSFSRFNVPLRGTRPTVHHCRVWLSLIWIVLSAKNPINQRLYWLTGNKRGWMTAHTSSYELWTDSGGGCRRDSPRGFGT